MMYIFFLHDSLENIRSTLMIFNNTFIVQSVYQGSVIRGTPLQTSLTPNDICLQLCETELDSLCESFDGSFVIRLRGGLSERRYVCRPAFNEMRFNWIKTIKNLLQNQNHFLEALMNPQEHAESLSKSNSTEQLP